MPRQTQRLAVLALRQPYASERNVTPNRVRLAHRELIFAHVGKNNVLTLTCLQRIDNESNRNPMNT